MSSTVAIEQLVLRVPGIAREDAPALVTAIAERVQSRLRGVGRDRQLALVELRVRVPSGLRRDELVERIAAQIVEACDG